LAVRARTSGNNEAGHVDRSGFRNVRAIAA
jgi:hypothetical protein